MSVSCADSNLMHKFPYQWYLCDLCKVEKNGKKVFSCFSCGGGSSMGYKLAGYEIVGNCEIDPKVAAVYEKNNHPQHSFVMDIRKFNQIENYPDELYDLDILDGSPPCSTFSMAGEREAAWGKEKAFREGQKKQRLDDLFFDFIKTAKRLNPKIVVAENVEGLILGNAKGYVNEIVKEFNAVGYAVQMFLLNASKMGVPQCRKRVFFIARKKELKLNPLKIQVNEPPIFFKEFRDKNGVELGDGLTKRLLEKRKPGDTDIGMISKRERGKRSNFNAKIIDDNSIPSTQVSGNENYRFYDGKKLTRNDIVNIQSFPQDYDFLNQSPQYICGMSVPPVMMAHIASTIYDQWLVNL